MSIQQLPNSNNSVFKMFEVTYNYEGQTSESNMSKILPIQKAIYTLRKSYE